MPRAKNGDLPPARERFCKIVRNPSVTVIAAAEPAVRSAVPNRRTIALAIVGDPIRLAGHRPGRGMPTKPPISEGRDVVAGRQAPGQRVVRVEPDPNDGRPM